MTTSFFSTEELKDIGFKSLGSNVLISKKSSIYSPEVISIGNNVRIDDFSILSGGKEIILHDYIHIGAYSALFGGGGIEMEDFAGTSMNCTILSASDDFSGLAMCSPASRIIGIDPSEDMLSVAQNQSSHSNITYQKGYGNNTGIGDGEADIVSCATSVHWMEPKTSIAEIHRILRAGGVFAAFGPQVPFLPLGFWELAVAFNKFLSFVKQIHAELPEKSKTEAWKWAEILQHVKTCKSFSYTDELCFNKTLQWNADEYCNWLRTFSYVHQLISSGNAEVINAFESFENKAKKIIGDQRTSIFISYRMTLGII